MLFLLIFILRWCKWVQSLDACLFNSFVTLSKRKESVKRKFIFSALSFILTMRNCLCTPSNPLINSIHIIYNTNNINPDKSQFSLILNILLFFQFLPISLYIKPFIPPSEKFYSLCHNYTFRNEHVAQRQMKKYLLGTFVRKFFPLSVVIATVWQTSLPSFWYKVRKHVDQLLLYTIPWPKRKQI